MSAKKRSSTASLGLQEPESQVLQKYHVHGIDRIPVFYSLSGSKGMSHGTGRAAYSHITTLGVLPKAESGNATACRIRSPDSLRGLHRRSLDVRDIVLS